MLYSILKIPAKLALYIYCRHLRINKKESLQLNGPLLLACNHPNSFLDAIILCTLFKKPVYSLARGDVFANSTAAKILRSFNILPIYRIKEGTEHLHRNYDTFDDCIDIFKTNGIVLIFSEAFCENEWHLRTIKNGTARLAITAWEQNIPLTILPVGINYSSFKLFGKNIHINFGDLIALKDIKVSINDAGKLKNELTQVLQSQLQPLVYEIDRSDKMAISNTFHYHVSIIKKILLFIPAMLGWLMHAPLYIPLRKYISIKAFNSGHYDSIMVAAIALAYPFYLLLMILLAYWFIGSYWFLLIFIASPFFAWSFIQLKKQS